MTEETNNQNHTENEEDLSFAELFEMEENNTVVEVGNVAFGTIIGEDDECYLVDVGDKAESYIPKSEFRLDNIEEIVVGSTVEVFVERRKDEGGLLLSREKAIAIKVWEDIAKIQEADGTIQGKIESRPNLLHFCTQSY